MSKFAQSDDGSEGLAHEIWRQDAEDKMSKYRNIDPLTGQQKPQTSVWTAIKKFLNSDSTYAGDV